MGIVMIKVYPESALKPFGSRIPMMRERKKKTIRPPPMPDRIKRLKETMRQFTFDLFI